jgi:hypothetical protein
MMNVGGTATDETVLDAPACENRAPIHRESGQVDLSVMDEGFLAYRYGIGRGAGGDLGPGTWPVVDSTGTHRANVVVRGEDPHRDRSYTISDLSGQVLMALRRTTRFGFDISLYDSAGQELGWYAPTAGGGVRFVTPTGPVGAPTRATGSGTPVMDAGGRSIARVYGHAPDRPLNALGTWPSIDPDWTWYLVDKVPRLADPLRSFVLGVPCVAHWQLGETLAA